MPAIALSIPGLTVALRFDFGAGRSNTPRSASGSSASTDAPYRGPLFDLFDEILDLRTIGVEGLAPDYCSARTARILHGSRACFATSGMLRRYFASLLTRPKRP
jgi:hypothetical protein